MLLAAIAKLLSKYGPLSIVLSFYAIMLIYLTYIKLIKFFKKRELANSKCSNWLFNIRSNLPQVFLRSVTFQIYWNRTSAWLFSCKSTAYFQNNSSEVTSGGLPLIEENLWNKTILTKAFIKHKTLMLMRKNFVNVFRVLIVLLLPFPFKFERL